MEVNDCYQRFEPLVLKSVSGQIRSKMCDCSDSPGLVTGVVWGTIAYAFVKYYLKWDFFGKPSTVRDFNPLVISDVFQCDIEEKYDIPVCSPTCMMNCERYCHPTAAPPDNSFGNLSKQFNLDMAKGGYEQTVFLRVAGETGVRYVGVCDSTYDETFQQHTDHLNELLVDAGQSPVVMMTEDEYHKMTAE